MHVFEDSNADAARHRGKVSLLLLLVCQNVIPTGHMTALAAGRQQHTVRHIIANALHTCTFG